MEAINENVEKSLSKFNITKKFPEKKNNFKNKENISKLKKR